jgi:hypothetical protein
MEHRIYALEQYVVGQGIPWCGISCFKLGTATQQDKMVQLPHSQKYGFENIYESCIISSMQTLFPNLFGKTSLYGMDASQALPDLHFVEKWKNDSLTSLHLMVEHKQQPFPTS